MKYIIVTQKKNGARLHVIKNGRLMPAGLISEGTVFDGTLDNVQYKPNAFIKMIAVGKSGNYLMPSTVQPTHSGSMNAEGEVKPTPAVESASALATAKGIFDNAKVLAMDTTVLSGAGIGLGTGLALSWLMGVRGGNMVGITITTTVLGGWSGYGFSSGSYHSADGGKSWEAEGNRVKKSPVSKKNRKECAHYNTNNECDRWRDA